MTTIYHTQIIGYLGMVAGMWRDVRMCFGGGIEAGRGKARSRESIEAVGRRQT
jgi:hypothetical protein